MPILKTDLFGKIIEINYQDNEKEKLLELISSFKERLSEYKDLEGKVTDLKILFLTMLKAEDMIYELKKKENSLVINQIAKKNNAEITNKIKEIVNLNDKILVLKKENELLKKNNHHALEMINETNKRIKSILQKVISKMKIND